MATNLGSHCSTKQERAISWMDVVATLIGQERTSSNKDGRGRSIDLTKQK